MGFSWTPITQYVTEIAAAHVNQIKTNVDSVYTDLELDAYNWLYLPVQGVAEVGEDLADEIQHEHFKELRDAIDYADDMNYCRSHDVTYMGADDAVARGTVYTTQKSGHDSTHDVGVDGNYDSTVYSGQNSSYQASYNSGVDVSHDITVYYDYDNGILSWHEVTVHGDHKFTVYSSVKETYNSGFG